MTDLFDDILSGVDVVSAPPDTIHRVYRVVDFIDPDYDNQNAGVIVPEQDANIVTSELTAPGNWHAPVLDLDIPHRYVPSSTEGHGHLYLDIAVPFDQMMEWLDKGVELGIFETGWYNAALTRGFTAVRKEGIVKTDAERKAKDVPHF
jgi:hypothetical protein